MVKESQSYVGSATAAQLNGDKELSASHIGLGINLEVRV
jgi:hypothetical protein